MSSNLPPGVSDADIDRQTNGPDCICGHTWVDHEEDGTCIACECYKFEDADIQ